MILLATTSSFKLKCNIHQVDTNSLDEKEKVSKKAKKKAAKKAAEAASQVLASHIASKTRWLDCCFRTLSVDLHLWPNTVCLISHLPGCPLISLGSSHCAPAQFPSRHWFGWHGPAAATGLILSRPKHALFTLERKYCNMSAPEAQTSIYYCIYDITLQKEMQHWMCGFNPVICKAPAKPKEWTPAQYGGYVPPSGGGGGGQVKARHWRVFDYLLISIELLFEIRSWSNLWTARLW